ncbi:MAG: hypothetical protein ACOCQ4_00685 [bacterium]
MGFTSYSSTSRTARADSLGYMSRSINEIFTQNQKNTIHESMSCEGLKIREARDSEAHPATVPIILNLDVTGSMGSVPHHLVKEGLPKLVTNLIQRGVEHPSLLFTAIGDHECDRYPLQIGQFESGDEELDMWLTRTYLEGGGGGNHGESYLLAWYLAAFHTETDSYEKRGQKGFLFTVGDEPGLDNIPSEALKEIFGTGQYKTWKDRELLEEASKKWNVYHLNILRGRLTDCQNYWKQLLGDNCIDIQDPNTIPEVIAEIIVKEKINYNTDPIVIEQKNNDKEETDEIL